MRIHFTEEGWDDYQHWVATDDNILAAINRLIGDIQRDPHRGLGKPEPLRGDLAGWWSRRITGQHRLVYSVDGARGVDQRLTIGQCRYHY